MSEPQGYSVRPVPTLEVSSAEAVPAASEAITTASTSAETTIAATSSTATNPSSTDAPKTNPAATKPATTDRTTNPAATKPAATSSKTVNASGVADNTADPAKYTQLAGTKSGSLIKATAVAFPQDALVAANYKQLCPQGDCLTDCQNMSRVFQALPDGITANDKTYGRATSNDNLPDVTLFGVCSNLGALSSIAAGAGGSSDFASYFPKSDYALQNVTRDISMCLLDTCQATRDPKLCIDECQLSSLQTSDTSLSVPGMYPCLLKMCDLTCGLPYANQDVYGVGLVASYITQAILVLILAGAVIGLASWRFFVKHNTTKIEVSKKLKDSLETFLSAQCYFGICASIASYFLQPLTVDPLNGYALLSVAVTGFIPTTFTLMLYHSQGIRSWYTTFLTCTSYFFSTALFYMLIRNLSGAINNPRVIDRGLASLFKVESCGKSSAMSLCKQAFDSDPLSYLNWFYNWSGIPNIKTIPLLWVLSTVVLILLVGLQVYDKFIGRQGGGKVNATIRLVSLSVGSVLFGLALAYQARMIVVYTQMDVIDWNGWTFGQVVALLFWLPALLDCTRSYIRQLKDERKLSQKGYNYSQLNATTGSAQASTAVPVKTSSTPVQQQNTAYEPLRPQNVGLQQQSSYYQPPRPQNPSAQQASPPVGPMNPQNPRPPQSSPNQGPLSPQTASRPGDQSAPQIPVQRRPVGAPQISPTQ